MKRIFILVLALWVGATLLPLSAQAQKKGADFDYKDNIGVIKIKPGDPEVVVTLEAGGWSVAGRVVDSVTKAPIAKFRVAGALPAR